MAVLALPGSAGGAEPVRIAVPELDGALATVERFAALSRDRKLQSREARAMMSGELAAANMPTLGPVGKPDVAAVAEEGAVVRVPAGSGWPVDLYFYLKRSGGGRTIDAVRTLALPPFVEQLRGALRAKPDRTADEDAQLRNLDLTFKSDAELRVWFGEHRADLEALLKTGDAERPAMIKRLNGSTFDQANGYPQFVIGGILDNSVGFLFVPEGAD